MSLSLYLTGILNFKFLASTGLLSLNRVRSVRSHGLSRDLFADVVGVYARSLCPFIEWRRRHPEISSDITKAIRFDKIIYASVLGNRQRVFNVNFTCVRSNEIEIWAGSRGKCLWNWLYGCHSPLGDYDRHSS